MSVVVALVVASDLIESMVEGPAEGGLECKEHRTAFAVGARGVGELPMEFGGFENSEIMFREPSGEELGNGSPFVVGEAECEASSVKNPTNDATGVTVGRMEVVPRDGIWDAPVRVSDDLVETDDAG